MHLSLFTYDARSSRPRYEDNGPGAPRQRYGIEVDCKDKTDAQERLNILNGGASFGDGSGS